MNHLSLYFLGPPRVEGDGQVIIPDTRKAIALLAYLDVTATAHTRDGLALLLWPDYEQARARSALRRTLWALRQQNIDDTFLDVTRETLGLRAGAPVWSEVAAFRRQLADTTTHGHAAGEVCPACLPLLKQAAEIYRDDFLTGFTLRDSPNFDDWQYFQTESLRREFAGALERLVYGLSVQGDFDAAIRYARRWLALDRLREEAHRQLMQLYAWSGQRDSALRQYRETVHILEEELSVPPLEETTGLYQAIKENRLPPPIRVEARPSAASSPASVPLTEAAAPSRRQPAYPLIGRALEWQALQQAHAEAGRGYFIALEGEAGIGKTRLAEELLARAQAQGAMTLLARCYEGETDLAYSPFLEAMRRALNHPLRLERLQSLPAPWVSEAARLLPELTALFPTLPAAPSLEGPGAQSRFFEGMVQTLLALSSGAAPGLLFLDDLHWADSASLDLLTYLVRRLSGRPLLALAAWRGETPASQRLRQLADETQRAGTGRLISLARLAPDDVADLVESAHVILPATAHQRLYHETEGIPFFVVEYLAMIANNTPATADWTMPVSVRALLQSRLAVVDEVGRQLLQAAAVVGRSFDFDTLRDASGRSDEEVITALEALTAQGLIQELVLSPQSLVVSPQSSVLSPQSAIRNPQSAIPTPHYDFSHEKLRVLVYEEISLARRRLLHRRVADAFHQQSHGREVGPLASQLAHHYYLAGQEAQAADYFKVAGEYSRSLYANREALRHLQTALALGHPDATAIHEAIGDLHTLLGEYNRALTSYETAAALGQAEVLARIEHKLGRVQDRRGQWQLAESHFQAALAAGAEAGERARIYANWSLTAHRQEQVERARALVEQALAEADDDAEALAESHNIAGVLARHQGNLEEARHHLEQSLVLAEALDHTAARVASLNNLALVFGDSGDIDQALVLLDKALALCVAQGDRHRAAALHNNTADLLHAVGREDEAMSHLRQAVAVYADIGVEAGDWQPEIWKLSEW